MPATAASISSATTAMISSISRRLSACKQRRKASILQIAAEQGADPGAGDAKRIAGGGVIGQHEDIAEQFAHRAGLDLAAVRRARVAALFVPICEKLAVRRMFHTSTLPRRSARRDTSVPLSRTRIPRFVVQDRLCSVHAAAAFRPLTGLCGVNVKLTMRLAIGAGLLGSAHCIPRRFSPGAGEVVTQGGVKQFGRRAGRGGDVTRFPLRARSARIEGGLLRPSLFRCDKPPSADRAPMTRCSASTPVCALALQRQAAYWGAIARVSRRLRSSTPWNLNRNPRQNCRRRPRASRS